MLCKILALFFVSISCFGADLVIIVDKQTQTMEVYENCELVHLWKVSTAKKGFETPIGIWTPKRAINGAHTSNKYPGGDYKELGNMPYPTFFYGAYAIHGTKSIRKLGKPASHGCIRIHPKNAKWLVKKVLKYGFKNVLIEIK